MQYLQRAPAVPVANGHARRTAAAATTARRVRRRPTPTPLARARPLVAAAAAAPSSPSSPPPIVEWCPANAAASVDEEESDSQNGHTDAWRRPLEGWTRPPAAAAAAATAAVAAAAGTGAAADDGRDGDGDASAPPCSSSSSSSSSSSGYLAPVVALGKFDALHRGHRALARAAARECGGAPVLLSFSGMAAVLGWPPRRPLVARQDRARVLDLWARELAAEGLFGAEAATAAGLALAAEAEPEEEEEEQAAGRDRTGGGEAASDADSGGGRGRGAAAAGCHAPLLPPSSSLDPDADPPRPYPPVRQRYVPFASVRSLPPEAFVDLLRGQMRAAGAVAGANFRFGFKAAGDSGALARLCAARGMRCSVVGLLMRRPAGEGEVEGAQGAAAERAGGQGGGGEQGAAASGAQGERGAVSSSRVREQLAAGRVEAAARSLGRPHRLVYVTSGDGGDARAAAAAPAAPSAAPAAPAATPAESAAAAAAGNGGGGGGGGDHSAPPFLPLLASAAALRNQPPCAGEYRALVSCFPLPDATSRDACLLELETQERRQRTRTSRGRGPHDGAAAAAAGARVFRAPARVRVSADGDISAEAGAARRCFGVGRGGAGGGQAQAGPGGGFVLSVDLLGRSGEWAAAGGEQRTEDEEEGGQGEGGEGVA